MRYSSHANGMDAAEAGLAGCGESRSSSGNGELWSEMTASTFYGLYIEKYKEDGRHGQVLNRARL